MLLVRQLRNFKQMVIYTFLQKQLMYAEVYLLVMFMVQTVFQQIHMPVLHLLLHNKVHHHFIFK
jgi:hypothetical protein